MTTRLATRSRSSATVEWFSTAVRIAVRFALWLAVGFCAAWAVSRVVGLDRFVVALIPPVSFTPYVAAGSVAVLCAAAVLRAWRATVVSGVVAAALVACVLPRCLPDGGGATTGPSLRVLNSNMDHGTADAKQLVDLVRRFDVQVLALEEFTPDAERALDAAGLATLLPHRAAYPQQDTAWGSAVYSRFPLHDDGLRTEASGFTQARVTVEVPGGRGVGIEAVHACPPTPPACSATDLPAEPPATKNGTIRVLSGDFNATLDHANLRRLIATGYRDAASVRGKGLIPSWPFLQYHAPWITIDHILADRRVGVARYSAHTVHGSDHRALFAELVLPR